jgi:hypothetical protein
MQNEVKKQRHASAAAERYLVAYLGARICAPAISLPRRTVVAGGVWEMEEWTSCLGYGAYIYS